MTNRVKCLEGIATERIYKTIVTALQSAAAGEKVQVSSSADSSVDEPSAADVKQKLKQSNTVTVTVAAIREKLDQDLVGIYRDVRKWLPSIYLYLLHNEENIAPPTAENQAQRSSSVSVDFCLLLDCILDKQFTEFHFCRHHICDEGSPNNFYPLKIVETVSRHCAESMADISFALHDDDKNSLKLPKSIEAPWARSFASLTALTKMDIYGVSTEESDCIQFFSHLGSSCPNLKQLELNSFPFGRKQQLALVLGDKAQQVIPLIHSHSNRQAGNNKQMHRGAKSKLHRLQFAEKYVTPICRSLEHLDISDYDRTDFRRDSDRRSSTFLLRHFPRLKILKLPFNHDIISGIEFLHKMSQHHEKKGKIFQVTAITDRGLRLKSTANNNSNHLRNLLFHLFCY